MKKRVVIAVVLAVELFVTQPAPAQGTLYLSNLGHSPVASGAVGSDSWLAESFITGTNAGGYVLNSVQLLMDAASGSPSGFTVSIYSSSNAMPQSNLGNLSGSTTPITPGTYTYFASGIMLSPSALYAVVLAATTPIGTGAYDWSITTGGSTSDQLWEYHLSYNSSDGLSWDYSRSSSFQLGIYATEVPEPSSSLLILLGSGVFIYVRNRNQKHSAPAKSD